MSRKDADISNNKKKESKDENIKKLNAELKPTKRISKFCKKSNFMSSS